MSEDLKLLEKLQRRAATSTQLDSEHSAKPIHRRLRDLVVGVARKPGVMHLRDLGARGAPFRDAKSGFVLAFHSHLERLESALEQPAGEGIRYLAPGGHLALHLVHERLAAANDAGQKVVVTVQILRGGVYHYVDA